MSSIEKAIQQAKFDDEYHRVQVNLLFTSAWLNQQTGRVLKPYGLSLQQFNILRILRGRGSEPSSIRLLTDRMIDKMSNASRLVDRLEDKGLVKRTECLTDRRRVDVLITPAGLELIAEASAAVVGEREAMFRNMTREEAVRLSELMDKVRG